MKRPIQTHYDDGRVARSTTPKAAARAAFRRLLDGDYKMADILSESGQQLAFITIYKREISFQVVRPRAFRE